MEGLVHRVYFLLVLEVNVFVEAATSGACSRICWRLPLPLYGLNDLPGLGINPSKWIHTVSVVRMDDGVPPFAHHIVATRYASTPRRSRRRSYQLLLSNGIVSHKRLLMDGGRDINVWIWSSNHNLMVHLVLPHIR